MEASMEALHTSQVPQPTWLFKSGGDPVYSIHPQKQLWLPTTPDFCLHISHFDRLYMFLKSIIHFQALLPPYNKTQEAFSGLHTPLAHFASSLWWNVSKVTSLCGRSVMVQRRGWQNGNPKVWRTGLTWVGARDTCVSKKSIKTYILWL